MNDALLQFPEVNRINTYAIYLFTAYSFVNVKWKVEAFSAEMSIIYKTSMIIGITLQIYEHCQ